MKCFSCHSRNVVEINIPTESQRPMRHRLSNWKPNLSTIMEEEDCAEKFEDHNKNVNKKPPKKKLHFTCFSHKSHDHRKSRRTEIPNPIISFSAFGIF
ncbi:hypothetical protein TSUD_105850 [Trifolium subterraneum]|uniref:Uncharacterized protein n=1 Tax=Trifolium subterraneum TaxID=3900 RepID=A0A2Z6MLQ0_TRISU|nr:hypothetical protein TSUD_105850 [Trifolium subterraneum]